MGSRLVFAFVLVLAATYTAGCARRVPGGGPSAAPAPLPSVAALPMPSPEPMIVSAAPVGDAGTLAQLRIVFRDDLIPLEQLESPGEDATLAHFSIEPALPGRFRFLTPRMVGFEPDRAWPAATRVRVTIAKGLRDLHGRTLPDDVAWTFSTPAIQIGDLPGKDDAGTAYELMPRIHFSANLALDRASLEAHAYIAPRDRPSDRIALVVPPDTASSPSAAPTETPAPDEAFDPSQRDYRGVLVPSRPLAKATTYDITIAAGVLPRDGNVPSDRAFTGSFTTHDDLRFVAVTQAEGTGRFTGGDPVLTFSTPIDPHALAALSLSPVPPGATAFAAGYDGTVGINASLLAPDTQYAVTIAPSLRDTFGQQLGTARRVTFRTGDLAPDVWAPSGANLFPAARDVRLNVVAVNAPPGAGAIFRALRPADVVEWPDPSGAPDRGDMLPPALAWPPFDVRGPRNVERTIEVPLRAKLGAPDGVLAYGVRATLPGATTPYVASGVVQLTDLGAFVQVFPDSARAIVNRISDGTPVAGARVEIYPSQTDAQSKTAAVPCASGSTAADGVATIGRTAFLGCALHDAGEGEAPAFVTIVRLGRDWTYVRTDPFSGDDGSFFNGWSSGEPIARGTIYSDRDLYQPGETAQLTAAGWFLVDGTLQRGTAPSYAITLELPNGRKRELGRRALDAFGMASFPVALAADDPLGSYVVRATAGNGETLTGDFRVAEFKPPNFKVDLALDRAIAQRGTSVGATATNAYLFGAPLAGTSTHYTVTRSATEFTPHGRDDFTFGRHWFWPDEMPDAATDVLDTSAQNGNDGTSRVSVPVAATLPYPMTYEVDAETTDASNVAVADSKTFTALPSGTLIGVKSDDVGTAGTPLGITAIATDPSGAARAGTHVHVELQSATYASATQIVEGAEQPVESVTYRTVAEADVTTAAQPVRVALTPPKPGDYRVRATESGANAAGSETDAEVFVGGSGEAAWLTQDPNALTVKLDKSTYAPGETATALVQSPFRDAEVRLAVVRHGVLWETTARTSSAAPTFRFTVTPAMLPNAVVEAFAVRRGAPPAENPANGANALARAGFAPFDVALGGKYVTATLRADAATLAPAARQTVRVHLADAAKNGVAGEVTLIVANDAVLRLTGYRPPDLVKTVYAEQPISTRFADNRSALVLRTLQRPLEKGWGFGGGLSGEEADPRVRRKFSPLAYFAGALRTDAHGDASASFVLPDDLTTWRVMAVASTKDGRFGNGETTFRTTKPLVANPVMPQFVRPGDSFEGGVAVTNGTGARGTLHIDATLTPPLRFDRGGTSAAETRFDAPLEAITKAYRFPIVANATGTSTATIRVGAAGKGDAFAIPVPVRDRDVLEAVAQTGATTNGARVPLVVAAGTPLDAGGLDVELDSSLLPEITVAANDALAGDERLAFLAASRLAIAADLVRLGTRAGAATAFARERAARALATLRDLRRGDGGFAAYWRAEASDPWDSLPALIALARARDAGVGDAALLDGARTYAAHVLADPSHAAAWCKDALCKAQLRLQALEALDAAGDRRTTFLSEIDAERDRLSFADRARLARLETSAPGYATRAASLTTSVEGALYLTARGAAATLPSRYGWLDDAVVAQAQVLRLELARGAPPETLDRVTRALLEMRRNGSFGCACEDAEALGALVDVAARETPADFTATASLAGRTIARVRFAGTKAPQRTTTVPLRALPAGTNTLALTKSGSGTLHWAVIYRYRLGSNAPGRLAGLRVTRLVRVANTADVLATFGLTGRTAPLTLAPARVYDVELQIITDHPVERVVITDPLPAGLEAVDTQFATTSAALHVPAAAWQIGDQQIRSDRVEAYADHLEPGIYRLHYLARSVTPGTFLWPGAEAHLADRPEEFGRTAASAVVVSAAR